MAIRGFPHKQRVKHSPLPTCLEQNVDMGRASPHDPDLQFLRLRLRLPTQTTPHSQLSFQSFLPDARLILIAIFVLPHTININDWVMYESGLTDTPVDEEWKRQDVRVVEGLRQM